MEKRIFFNLFISVLTILQPIVLGKGLDSKGIHGDYWLPDIKGGYSVLDNEDGFFYWIFQTMILPPCIAFLVIVFGIVACVRGQICFCCMKKPLGGGVRTAPLIMHTA